MSAFALRVSTLGLLCLATSLSLAAPETAPLIPPPPARALFSSAERARLITYWNAPGRYEIGPRAGSPKDGAYAVRLTPQASRWFHAFNGALQPGKLAPTQKLVAITEASRPWESWIAAKLSFDRALAAQQAAFANAQLFATPLSPALLSTTQSPLLPLQSTALVPHPGPVPPDLLARVGNPPPFATVVLPRRYTVRFESGEAVSYTDQIAPSNPRYPSLRFAEGVASMGTALSKLAPAALDQIFAASGLSPTESRVLRAVSRLEGGFDSINTYDTGFVSVGFIQFAALESGGGSLAEVLKVEKTRFPLDYARDFTAFGVDVTPEGRLCVVDPASGAELVGPEAALKIIDDKRLTAVFGRAGGRSTAFRAAQIQVAKANYYPASSAVAVSLGGKILTGRVGDVMRSEAGLATLFDRKVNIGNIRFLNQVLEELMLKRGLTSLEETLPFEREVIVALKWRSDFLKDPTLSQPQ